MARLPQPGSDSGNWGNILNDYLLQTHKADGTLKDDSVTNTAIADGTISEVLLDTAVQTKLNATGGAPDWSTITNKPAVIAAGADQAAARTAIGAGTSNLVIGTTSTTAKAGDYAPTKADVGLGNVDNTSDATKNSAAATLTNKILSGANNTFSNIGISSLAVSGTANTTTYLRGDGSWQTPTGTSNWVNVKDYGATGNGSTDDTSAIASAYTAAASAGKVLYVPAGTYAVTALPDFADNSVILGDGARKSTLLYAGTGTLRQLSNKYGIAFRSIGFRATAAGAVLLQLSNSFRVSFHDFRFLGAHTDSSGSTYRTQVGLLLDNNSGANFMSQGDFENLGNGIKTSCIQNQVVQCKFTECYRSVYGVGGTANAGLSVTNSEFVGGAVGTTESHIYIDGSANNWDLVQAWFEKGTYACRVGVGGTGGPSRFTMVGCKIGASTIGVELVYCRQPALINCEWDVDQGGTQTEVVINTSNAEEGVAIGNITTIRSDFNDSDFPQYWTVTRRGQFRAPNVTVSSNIAIAGQVNSNGPVQVSGAARMYSGSGVPANATGSNGDFYFRTDTPGTANQRLYTRSAGAWTAIL